MEQTVKTDQKKEIQVEQIELPPKLDETPTRSKKFRHSFFSPAIFMESLKSNWVGWLVVGLGNALIIIIIVLILSTLNFNVTKTSLSDLFDSASLETQVKTESVSLYTTLEESGKSYILMDESQQEGTELSSQAFTMTNDTKVQDAVKAANGIYDLVYIQKGKDPQKTKEEMVDLVDRAMDGNGGLFDSISGIKDLTDQEKKVIKAAVPYYCDAYYAKAYTDGSKNNTTISSRDLITSIVAPTAQDLLLDGYTTSKDDAKAAGELIHTNLVSFNAVLDAQPDMTEAEKQKLAKEKGTETSFDLITTLADDSIKEEAKTVVDHLKAAYNKTDASGQDYKTAFIDNKENYRTTALKEGIESAVVNTIGDLAYYNYLPEFTVNYLTDDLGYPIRYIDTGETDTNGNPIVKSERIMVYKPDLFTPVADKMGTKSNIAQKMHKDIITGEGYSDAEIAEAKKEADEEIQNNLLPYLTSFMDEFTTYDENGKNQYFDGENLIESALLDHVSSIISDTVEKELIKRYNEKYDATITSADQIDARKAGMDGKTMLDTANGYATSGIYSYIKLYQSNLEAGYSQQDAMIAAMVRSSTCVMDQLPSGVTDTLNELADFNTYGVFVGIISYGMACVLIPMVYTIITANSLVSEKVETGSLAFTLATPIKRSTFIFTEGIFLLVTEAVLSLLLFLGGLAARGIGILTGGTDLVESLSIANLSMYGLGNFAIVIAISGICFLSSCLFNKTRHSIAIGGGLNIFFFICTILGLFGTKAIPATVRIEAMNFFNYISIFSLYDGMAVMEGNPIYWAKLVGLFAITIVTYAAGSIIFTKKDLPL